MNSVPLWLKYGMRTMDTFRTITFTIFLMLTLSAYANDIRRTPPPRAAYSPDEVVVKLKRGGEGEAKGIAADYGLELKRMLSLSRYCLFRIPDGRDPVDVAADLVADAAVESAQPNHYSYPLSCPLPSFNGGDRGKLWYLDTIRASECWDKACGNGVKVAVIDTGAQMDHADIQANIELADSYDFSNRDGDPSDTLCGGHGTMVAAIIAGVDDGFGVVGVAPEAKLMILKVIEWNAGYGDCIGTDADIAEAVQYACDNGADIINMSLGTPLAASIQEDAVEYARQAGVMVVGASGNFSEEQAFQGQMLYPAEYPQVLAVGASTTGDRRTSYSQYGSNLDIVAPGGNGVAPLNDITDIFGAALSGGFQIAAGTSFACPMVAGAAALLISAGLGPMERVEARIKGTAVDLGPEKGYETGWDIYTGFGLLNCFAALNDSPTRSSFSKPINYPNPYYIDRDPYTVISFSVTDDQAVSLYLYDAAGELVRTWKLSREEVDHYNEVRWDGKNGKEAEVGSGVYYLVLKGEGSETAMHKIAVIHGR